MQTTNERERDEPKNQPLPKDGPSLEVDVDYYQAIIDDPEISDARKRELIAIIGRIVLQFIDLGFGVHPVQAAKADKRKRLTSTNRTDEKERQRERRAERIDS